MELTQREFITTHLQWQTKPRCKSDCAAWRGSDERAADRAPPSKGSSWDSFCFLPMQLGILAVSGSFGSVILLMWGFFWKHVPTGQKLQSMLGSGSVPEGGWRGELWVSPPEKSGRMLQVSNKGIYIFLFHLPALFYKHSWINHPAQLALGRLCYSLLVEKKHGRKLEVFKGQKEVTDRPPAYFPAFITNKKGS